LLLATIITSHYITYHIEQTEGGMHTRWLGFAIIQLHNWTWKGNVNYDGEGSQSILRQRAILLDHAIDIYNNASVRTDTDRLLVATPSDFSPRQTDPAKEPVVYMKDPIDLIVL